MLRSEPKQLSKESGAKNETTASHSSGKVDKTENAARYAEGENIRVKLIETMIIKENPSGDSPSGASPGDFSGLDVDRSISIAKVNKQRVLRLTCGDGSKLGVLMLQPASKRVMSASDFMNGQAGRDVYWIPFESEGESQTSNSTANGEQDAKKTSQ
jgi:hypothetical protein